MAEDNKNNEAEAAAAAEAEAEAKGVAEAAAGKGKGKKVKVRVICDGVLGPLGLRKGDITDDADYVAILDRDEQQLVEKA